MTKVFRTIQETKGDSDFGQLFSDQIYNATLAVTTNTQLTVPGGGIMGGISSFGGTADSNKVYAYIRVSEGKEVWFAVNATADVPAGTSFAQDTSELITPVLPMCRLVKVGDVLNFYAAAANTSVSVTFYALPS